jgi:hypothetical protein
MPIPSDLVLERFAVAKGGDALLLPVRFGGTDHLFIVDTGCARTVFDLSLPLGKPRRRHQAVTFNGNIEVDAYDPPEATVGQLPLLVAEIDGLDLTWAREASGRPSEGILGMDFLGKYVMRIDFDRGELLFLKSSPRDAGEAVSIDWRPGNVPRVMADFTGMENVWFAIDTGGTGHGSGTLGTSTVRDLLTKDALRNLGAVFSESAGGRYSARVYRARRLTLGGFAVDNPVFNGTQTLNVLGLGFWSRFTVTFDFPEHVAYLAKGERYGRPDVWNASGLRLGLKNGSVTIDAVHEGSPGAREGVLAGDVLLEFGDLHADTATLFELKSCLCKEGQFRCVVRRGGQDHCFTISLTQ